jgi:hypothetical protein
VQGVEHRPGDVPVEIVGFQVQRVSVSQQPGKAMGNVLTVLFVDADIHMQTPG